MRACSGHSGPKDVVLRQFKSGQGGNIAADDLHRNAHDAPVPTAVIPSSETCNQPCMSEVYSIRTTCTSSAVQHRGQV
jgi:hypothetical protein